MTYILYIDAQTAYFYGQNFSGPIQMQLPIPEVLRDLEIVSSEKLDALVKTFVETNKILPGEIFFVISDPYSFVQDLTDPAGPKQRDLVQAFLAAVPFEETYNRTYQIGKAQKVIAVNKSFCDYFSEAFEKMKFVPIGVVPYPIIQSVMPEFANTIDVRALYGKLDSLKQYNIYTAQKEVSNTESEVKKDKPKNTRQTVLIGVFIFLILVLGIVAVNTFVLGGEENTNKTPAVNPPVNSGVSSNP